MIDIRPATSADCSAIFELASQLATSFTVEKTAFKISFAETLADSAAVCLLAEKNGVVVGYVLGSYRRAFYANGRVSWVEELFVEEALRKEGIGRELMQGFENWAREQGCKQVALATRRAGPFYEVLDYQDSAAYFKKKL